MTIKKTFDALRAQVLDIERAQIHGNVASGSDLAHWRSLNDLATTELLGALEDSGWTPPTPEPPDPPTTPGDELRPPDPPTPSPPLGAPSATDLQPVNLKQWNSQQIDAGQVIERLHLLNSDHIALHHGAKDGVLQQAAVSACRWSDIKMWASRLYRVGYIDFESCSFEDVEREHCVYANMSSAGLHPVNDIALWLNRCTAHNIGGQVLQTVLEEIGNDTPLAPNPWLRMNETPNFDADAQPGGWILVDGCMFTSTAQHTSRGSFALSNFRSRHHVAVRHTKIDNRLWANGNSRLNCRGHLMVQGVEEYTRADGVEMPAWDRHVLVEDCEFYGNGFQQPLMLLEKGLADVRIRRVKSRSTGGQDWIRVELKPGGRLLVEDWDGPGRLEVNGKMFGRLDSQTWEVEG